MPDEPTVQPEPGSGGESTPPATPPAPATPAPTEDAAAWRNMVPKDFRDHPSLKDYKDFGSFVKSHVNLVGLLGREPRVPAADAPPDQWTQFFSALGRPDTADKYTLPLPQGEGAPEVIPEVVDGFKKIAHDAGLTQSQAHKVAEWYFGVLNEQSDSLAAETAALTERTERELRREWGQAYDSKVRSAAKVFSEFGGKDLLDWMETSGAGSNSHLIRMAAKFAEAMSEDRLGHSRGANFGYTPAEAQKEIGRLELDKDFQKALWDSQHPGHTEAVRRRSELYAAAFPTEEA